VGRSQLALAQRGVQLDLVERGQRVGLAGQPTQVFDGEVGDADRAYAVVVGN